MKQLYVLLKHVLFCMFITILFSQCSHHPNVEENSIRWEREIFELDTYEQGIFINDNGTISIKCKDKPFIAILDILAYKLRFNYTLTTKMHTFTLSIYDKKSADNWIEARQLIFRNANAFFMYAVDIINSDFIPDQSKISYQWTGDGPCFFRVQNRQDADFQATNSIIIKKIFFNSIAVNEGDQDFSQNQPLNPETDQQMEVDIQQQEPFDNNSFNMVKNVKYKINSLLKLEEKSNVNILEIETQNALLLRGDKNIIDYISNIIYSMDVEYPQVLVETKVFEYDDSLAKKIGTSINYIKPYGTSNNNDGDEVYGSQQTGSKSYNVLNNLYQDIFNTKIGEVNKQLQTIPNIFFQLSDEEKKMKLLTQLAMHGRNGMVKILAEPRLLLKPGSKASIKLTTVKYVEAKAHQEMSNIENQSIDCGIQFEIIPIILAENKILLKIKLKQSEFIFNNEEKIVQSKNENIIDTKVVALDGELINIGGIILKKTSAVSSGIPYIKDIPYLGVLFGSKRNDFSKVRIEFMIKPTVKFLSKKLRSIKQDVHKQDRLFEKSIKKHFSF